MHEIILNTQQICKLFDCSRPTLGSMHRAGLPKAGRGKWPLFECFEWYIKNIADYDRESKESGELTAVKTVLYKTRCEKEAFELEIKRKKYFPIHEIEKAWSPRAQLVRTGLRNFSGRLPAVLVGKDRNSIRKILREETNQLLADYLRAGLHTPVTPEIKLILAEIDQKYPKQVYIENEKDLKNGK